MNLLSPVASAALAAVLLAALCEGLQGTDVDVVAAKPVAAEPVAVVAPPSPPAIVDAAPLSALAPPASAAAPVAPSAQVASLTPPAPPLGPAEWQTFSAAAALYRRGAVAAADALARGLTDPLQRTALEWVMLRASAAPDGVRLEAFAHAHPDWPAADWIRAVRESSLYSRHAAPAEIAAEFARRSPETAPGALARARAEIALGRPERARSEVGDLWRFRDLDLATEGAVLREFGAMLTPADHKYRADRLLYAEKSAAALRAAALAGPDEVALAHARLEAARGPLSARAIAAVPAALQADPGFLFAHVQDARRANRVAEATAWIDRAPRDAAALIDPDKWWSERRMVARQWLDLGDPRTAYRLCVEAATESGPATVDAAFHAGWIALRFLDDPGAAARHFSRAAAAAATPLALARAHYWRGRAAEALNQPEDARAFYMTAAHYPIAYYGQLAAARLGAPAPLGPRRPAAVAVGEARWPATRIVELYFDAGLDDFAIALADAAASRWSDEAQLAALGEIVARRASASANVAFGKIATERGFALDAAAFPTNGVPSFAPLPHSADLAGVLAIARQESEFLWRAASGAGAKGLMQILPATAQDTARRSGVPFDYQRLVADPAFNLQLGAAYLGQLIEDEGGSVPLALAAYNAGSGRVAQWLAAYGDPRSGSVDMVDWIERIPFDETRDYVQRVSENLAIYRARLSGADGVGKTSLRLARE